ncbi:hypothetical protein G6F42_024086 [Rhizopus arrhizus]|nr:hypothetical protein G6F42_024086 [Rhizopus arrhizus]
MSSSAAPMSFSGTTTSFHRPEQSFSSSSRRRHGASGMNHSNKTRRARRSKTSSASSSTVTSNVTVRKSAKRAVRHNPVMSQSSSLRTSRNNTKKRSNRQRHDVYHDGDDDAFDQDEGFVNEDGYVDEDEIKQSIAKAKAEIQKGMEVLDLIKPMEEAAQSWEDELEAFERAEKELYEKTSQIERSESDEGNYTSTSSPVDDGQRQGSNDLDLMMEIEALSVPTWDHKSTTTNAASKMARATLDDEDNQSSASSSSMHSYAKNDTHASIPEKQNPQLVRMLHQIQSDIRVKEELVSHLEKSETKYSFMRRKFDDKIAELHAQLAELQKDRDQALAKTKSTFAAAPNRAHMAMQLKEKQQLIETRHVLLATSTSRC